MVVPSGAALARFSVLMFLSSMVAAVGLLQNSAAVVIGAMMIAPLMSPIMGVAASLVMGWGKRLLLGLLLVLAAALGAIAVGWMFAALLSPAGTGLPAEVVLRSRPGEPIAGKVARVELLGDSVTEERIAQVAFETLPGGISIGELAEVTVRLPEPDAALVLPNAAIKYRHGSTGVWLATADGLRFATVDTGAASLDGKVQVLRGLAAGDRVVVHSERELSENTRIKVVDGLAGAPR